MEDTVTKRNDQIYKLLSNYLNNTPETLEFKKPFSAEEVEALFRATIWGHRELVLTVLLTRLVYPNYKATANLYQYSPRSVYEKPIRTALREHGLPCTKSAPLNIAKNIKRLNADWATNKRGGSLAKNVVNIVEKIEKVSVIDLEQFAKSYIGRYKQEATRVKNLEVKLPVQENPLYIADLCVDLIDHATDGGATAQFIVGLLMEANNKCRRSGVTVSGYTDSVSATNTTSKKPGDIVELVRESDAELVYEVTTKPFDHNRLIDSHEAMAAYEHDISDVFVICRPKDVPASLDATLTAYLMASTQYQELSYYFVNIYQYVQAALLFITTQARRDFYENLITYVNDINRSEKVKIYLKEWHDRRT
jgi:hypothetical protein